ncbi:unnamed protein product, partial [Vitis vinifera]
MASSSSSPPQSSHQFLTSVLSRRGPSALPYAEDVKWMIRQHFLSLADAFPALHPQTAAYTHNDGRTVNLLRVEGNIPMVYLQVTYYIPIVVWLMEAYPRQPPCVYVNPTRQMVIKRPHPHEQISKGLREMQDEKEGLELQLQMILINSDIMEAWLRENQGKRVMDVENAFEYSDFVSSQMLECSSSDLAIDDVIYALDKALQEGSIPFDQYLKNVRMLSREQFLHRAMSAKARATQLQVHVSSMAQRASS